MRRITWMVTIVMFVSIVLSGCGTKNADDVVKELDHVVGKLESYQGTGSMVLQTGQDPQEYQVEVWYKNPNYYRISLTNDKKDITQIVLRNDDGVFVLTPHLNKMFRFQSDWPENSGQVYLYQSLVQSIVMDQERQFLNEDEAYVFDVAANYQNGTLSRQKIWLDKKNYAPKHVEVADEHANVMVVMDFKQFEFGKKFEKDSFDMQRNMTSWKIENLPVMATVNPLDPAAMQQASKDANKAEGKTTARQQNFGVIEPEYMPQGVKKQDVSDVKLGEQQAVLLRYSGEYNYTLLEHWPQEKSVSAPSGELIDLGFAFGVLTGEDKKTLTWTYDGVEFKLSTADLPQSEMYKVAQSVQGQMGK